MDAFSRLDMDFKIVVGRSIGKQFSKNIFYQVSHEFTNIFRFIEYPPFLLGTIRALENQDNKCYLSSAELEYWENKWFMHEKFEELSIAHPKTYRLKTCELFEFDTLDFPFILKEINSQGSKGLHKIENRKQLIEKANYLLSRGKQRILAQKLVAMSRDLRVTVVGDTIRLAYWRINNSREWRPTSTSHGSAIDFDNFPENWRQYFIDVTRKLNLSTAAYDVAWENDDLETVPQILEVSTSYQPNPVQPERFKNLSYKKYRQSFFNSNPYFKTRVETQFDFCYYRMMNWLEK